MILNVRGYSRTHISRISGLVRNRIIKTLAGSIRPFDRVLIPYLDNWASIALLEFLKEANYPQYVALIADKEIDGRPTYVYDGDVLELLFRGVKRYHVYWPLDPAEIAYLWLKYEPVVFHGIFPFRRVHPWELGAYLLARNKRVPRRMYNDHVRRLVLKLEAYYPRLIVAAASFVEKVSTAFKDHVYSEPVEIEPADRLLIGK